MNDNDSWLNNVWRNDLQGDGSEEVEEVVTKRAKIEIKVNWTIAMTSRRRSAVRKKRRRRAE